MCILIPNLHYPHFSVSIIINCFLISQRCLFLAYKKLQLIYSVVKELRRFWDMQKNVAEQNSPHFFVMLSKVIFKSSLKLYTFWERLESENIEGKGETAFSTFLTILPKVCNNKIVHIQDVLVRFKLKRKLGHL